MPRDCAFCVSLVEEGTKNMCNVSAAYYECIQCETEFCESHGDTCWHCGKALCEDCLVEVVDFKLQETHHFCKACARRERGYVCHVCDVTLSKPEKHNKCERCDKRACNAHFEIDREGLFYEGEDKEKYCCNCWKEKLDKIQRYLAKHKKPV